MENGEVDNLKRGVAGLDSDYGEDCCGKVAGADTDDERDKLSHLFAVYRADDDGEEGNKAAEKSNIGVCCGYSRNLVNNGSVLDNLSGDLCHNLAEGKVADCIACKRKTDD